MCICSDCVTASGGCCKSVFNEGWKIILLPQEVKRISELTGKKPAEFVDNSPLSPYQKEWYATRPELQDKLWARTPEEAALLMRWKVFIGLRWVGILGIIIAILIASQLFRIGFPILPVFFICGLQAAYNFFFVYQLRILQAAKHGQLIQSARTYLRYGKELSHQSRTGLREFCKRL